MIEQIKFREVKIVEPSEKVNAGVIEWGSDNLYPYFLNTLLFNCAVHSGIVNTKVNMMFGLGFDLPENVDRNLGSTYSINEILEKAIRDNEIANLFYLKLTKFGKSYIINNVPFEDVRVSADGNYLVSENWSNKRKYKPVPVANYFKNPDADVSIIQFSESFGKFILDNGNISIGNYAVPSYAGGITAIKTAIEISNFNYSEIINSYKGGTAIMINNGVPKTEEEKQKIVNGIKNQATNRDKQGGMLVIFSKDAEHRASIEQVSGNNLPQRYQQTELNTIQNIMLAHSVSSPEIFGLIVPGSLGGNSTREEAMADFRENYILKRRKNIKNAFSFVLNDIIKLNIEVDFKDDLEEVTEENVIENQNDNFFSKVKDFFAKKKVSEEEALLMFSKFGVAKNKKKIIKSFSFNGKEIDIYKESKKEYFALNEVDKKVLKLISDGNSFEKIAESLKLKQNDLTDIFLKLQGQNFLDNRLQITTLGVINSQDNPIKVMYSYELRKDAPKLKGKESRAFCKRLIELDKLYERNEINLISTAIGVRDVWLYRGGWYSNPKTERNEPSCRHEWQQHLIL